MNSFLTGLYQISPVNQLAKGMEEFWKYYSKKREENFAQQGYEDKGYGHCERIIANVGELLENYSEILYKLNKETFKSDTSWTEEKFKEQFRDHLEPNLVLFITAAYIHDIGMCFPGIFKALNEVLKSSSGDSAAHINKIIHDYHNYATFIVLLEMNSLALQNFEIFRIDKKIPYLDNIPEDFKEEDIKKLATLKKYLTEIYKKYFAKYNNGSNGGITINKEDFFIILGIICLRHQKVEPHYVQSILRKFTPDRKETVDIFNKWDAFFTRAREWTDLAPDWFPKEIKPDTIVTDKKESNQSIEANSKEKKDEYIGPELIFSKADTKLDLLLVEALLQYGDKTEITIARLMKPTENNKELNGLEKFWKDTQWDNEKGYICTDMAPQVISSFARFRACRFIPLFLVKVKQNDCAKPAALDVMMYYFRFPKDKDIFSFIRYHNEKDFQELKFLDVIKFHLPVLLRYSNFEDEKKEKWLEINPRLEINLKRKELPFPTIDNELKKIFLHFINEKGTAFFQKLNYDKCTLQDDFIKISGFLENQRENGPAKKIDISDLAFEQKKQLWILLRYIKARIILKKILNELSSIEKTDNIAKGQTLIKELKNEIKENHPLYGKLKKLNYIIKQEYKLKSHIFILYEELEFIFYFLKITNNVDIMEKIRKRIELLQEKHDDFGNKRPEELFPYTPQNRDAIIEFSRSIKPKMDNKELFFKSSGLTIPPSFELMAILNLFQQEE